MNQIIIATIGTLKEDYLRHGIDEYKKRLLQFAKVDEINIKEEKIKDEDNPKEISDALDSEGKRLLSQIPKDYYKVALCIEGVQYSSTELAEVIRTATSKCGKIAFIIGSSHGLSPNVKSSCDLKLSFSKMTFPHQLMRLVLFEAIYRSYTIIANKSYHK